MKEEFDLLFTSSQEMILDTMVAKHRHLNKRLKGMGPKDAFKYLMGYLKVGSLVKAKEIYQWVNNPIEIKIYPKTYNNQTEVWVWPDTSIIRDEQGRGQLFFRHERPELIEYLDTLGYPEVQFLFQEEVKE